MNRIPSRPVEVVLQSHYLAKTFDVEQRLVCHFYNFDFLTKALRPFSLAELFTTGLTLLERAEEGAVYRIRLGMPQMHRNQGELAVSFLEGEEELYATGFTITPADLFGLPPGPALLISRMQGAPGRFEDIHRAAKAFRDITPQALLFAALQGCARALGLPHIVGTSARVQLSYALPEAVHYARCYDEFFESVDATRCGGFYVFDAARIVGVFDNLPVKHRARTKAKRKIKAEIQALAEEAMRPHVVTQAPAPSLLDRLRGRVGKPPPLAPGPTPMLQVSAIYLPTVVGAKSGARIVTTGKAGCLVCGPFPYTYLEAGAYELRFEVEADGEPVAFTLDVSTDRGKRVLARKDAASPREASLAFALEGPADEIEFRLFVPEAASLAVRGVALFRRAAG